MSVKNWRCTRQIRHMIGSICSWNIKHTRYIYVRVIIYVKKISSFNRFYEKYCQSPHEKRTNVIIFLGPRDSPGSCSTTTVDAVYFLFRIRFLPLFFARGKCVPYARVQVTRPLRVTYNDSPTPSLSGKTKGLVVFAKCSSAALSIIFIKKRKNNDNK